MAKKTRGEGKAMKSGARGWQLGVGSANYIDLREIEGTPSVPKLVPPGMMEASYSDRSLCPRIFPRRSKSPPCRKRRDKSGTLSRIKMRNGLPFIGLARSALQERERILEPVRMNIAVNVNLGLTGGKH